MKQKKNQKAGFSLIEVIFAMLFLTVVVFGVLRLQTSNLALTNTQKNQLQAYSYASQALEIAQGLGPEAFKNCETVCHLVDNGGSFSIQAGGTENLDNELFKRSFERTKNLAAGFILTARVTWQDSSGNHAVTSDRVIY